MPAQASRSGCEAANRAMPDSEVDRDSHRRCKMEAIPPSLRSHGRRALSAHEPVPNEGHAPGHRSRPPGPQKPGGHFRSLFRSPVSFDGHEAMHQVFHRSVLRVCVGIDRSRLDDVDRDSAGPEITRQPSGQTLQGGLAHGIGGRARDGHPVAIDRAASPYCD